MNAKSAGKTALQVASHQGGRDMVNLLLKAHADVELKDSDGDTALHYSAFGYVFVLHLRSCLQKPSHATTETATKVVIIFTTAAIFSTVLYMTNKFRFISIFEELFAVMDFV